MIKTLSQLEIENFFSMIKNIYKNPIANIVLNGERLDLSSLKSGIGKDVCSHHCQSIYYQKFQLCKLTMLNKMYTIGRASQVAQWQRIHLQCRRGKRYVFDPWVGKILWRRKWQPIPVFLPGKSHRQRSLVGCSPWDCKRVRHDLATKQ